MKTLICVFIACFISLGIKAQNKDSLNVSTSDIFSHLVLRKSTLNDAIIEFGNSNKFDTTQLSSMTAHFLGGGFQTSTNVSRQFYFKNNSVVVRTPLDSDTIQSILFFDPFPIKTIDQITMGKSNFKKLTSKKQKTEILHRSFNGKQYSIIKFNNTYYGTVSKHKNLFEIQRLKRKRITLIILTKNLN